MNRNHKLILLAVVLIWACLTAAVIYQLTYRPLPADHRRGDGVQISRQTYGAVDKSISDRVNLTTYSYSGESGPGYSWNTVDGQVSWIGNPNMTSHSLQNLRLTVYVSLDSSELYGNLTLTQVGIHVLVNQTPPQIPSNALDHQEIVIPNLGLENPTFQYHFNCSTYIPPNPTPSPMGDA